MFKININENPVVYDKIVQIKNKKYTYILALLLSP